MKNINNNALFKLSYGLYVLTAREDNKDNGCIINVAAQVAESPARIMISVNKKNLTHDMVLHTGLFNICMLTEEAPMKVIEHFGFQSGRDINKFQDCSSENRSENSILYIPKFTNGFVSGKVCNSIDMGSHTIFIAEITEATLLDDKPSLTYNYYQQHIKPQRPQKNESSSAQQKAAGRWVCKVCGFVYEGDTMPDDFICPRCKHGKSDFDFEEPSSGGLDSKEITTTNTI